MKLPPPTRLGLKGFPSWRHGQSDSVLRIVDSPKRFVCLVQPTGAGKSLTSAAAIRLLGGQWAYLTATKSLQDQIASEFSSLGWLDIRGQSNYPCTIEPNTTVDLGPCHAGTICEHKTQGGCPYFDKLKVIRSGEASVTVTNYSWFLSHRYDAFQVLNGLVLDEAHHADSELSKFLACAFSRKDVAQYLGGYPPPSQNLSVWAVDWSNTIENEIESLKFRVRANRDLKYTLKRLKELHLKLVQLRTAKDEYWVIEETKYGWKADVLWPGPYAESMLFREIPKVILVSATVRPKTLALLGLKPDAYDFQESPSIFPISRRPTYYFKTKPRIAITYKSSDAILKLWIARMDNIIRRRLDRKGVIHCNSYRHRDIIYKNSRYRDLMITHESGEQAAALERFRLAAAPRIFISPSATTGIDLPYSACEYQLIAKVPFPDQRSRIVKARSKGDKDYGFYLACMDIVQAAGRGMRAADDQCEVFLCDDNIDWVKRQYGVKKRFMTEWFLQSCKRVESMPDPPPPLTRQE